MIRTGGAVLRGARSPIVKPSLTIKSQDIQLGRPITQNPVTPIKIEQPYIAPKTSLTTIKLSPTATRILNELKQGYQEMLITAQALSELSPETQALLQTYEIDDVSRSNILPNGDVQLFAKVKITDPEKAEIIVIKGKNESSPTRTDLDIPKSATDVTIKYTTTDVHNLKKIFDPSLNTTFKQIIDQESHNAHRETALETEKLTAENLAKTQTQKAAATLEAQKAEEQETKRIDDLMAIEQELEQIEKEGNELIKKETVAFKVQLDKESELMQQAADTHKQTLQEIAAQAQRNEQQFAQQLEQTEQENRQREIALAEKREQEMATINQKYEQIEQEAQKREDQEKNEIQQHSDQEKNKITRSRDEAIEQINKEINDIDKQYNTFTQQTIEQKEETRKQLEKKKANLKQELQEIERTAQKELKTSDQNVTQQLQHIEQQKLEKLQAIQDNYIQEEQTINQDFMQQQKNLEEQTNKRLQQLRTENNKQLATYDKNIQSLTAEEKAQLNKEAETLQKATDAYKQTLQKIAAQAQRNEQLFAQQLEQTEQEKRQREIALTEKREQEMATINQKYEQIEQEAQKREDQEKNEIQQHSDQEKNKITRSKDEAIEQINKEINDIDKQYNTLTQQTIEQKEETRKQLEKKKADLKQELQEIERAAQKELKTSDQNVTQQLQHIEQQKLEKLQAIQDNYIQEEQTINQDFMQQQKNLEEQTNKRLQQLRTESKKQLATYDKNIQSLTADQATVQKELDNTRNNLQEKAESLKKTLDAKLEEDLRAEIENIKEEEHQLLLQQKKLLEDKLTQQLHAQSSLRQQIALHEEEVLQDTQAQELAHILHTHLTQLNQQIEDTTSEYRNLLVKQEKIRFEGEGEDDSNMKIDREYQLSSSKKSQAHSIRPLIGGPLADIPFIVSSSSHSAITPESEQSLLASEDSMSSTQEISPQRNISSSPTTYTTGREKISSYHYSPDYKMHVTEKNPIIAKGNITSPSIKYGSLRSTDDKDSFNKTLPTFSSPGGQYEPQHGVKRQYATSYDPSSADEAIKENIVHDYDIPATQPRQVIKSIKSIAQSNNTDSVLEEEIPQEHSVPQKFVAPLSSTQIGQKNVPVHIPSQPNWLSTLLQKIGNFMRSFVQSLIINPMVLQQGTRVYEGYVHILLPSFIK